MKPEFQNVDAGPIGNAQRGDADFVREILRESGFDQATIMERLGQTAEGELSLRGNDLPILLRQTEALGPLDVLVRLFLMGVPVTGTAAEAVLRDAARWQQIGLVEIEDDTIRAAVRIVPHRSNLVMFDPPPGPGNRRTDYVMGIGRSTLTLERALPPGPIGRALDLGTGSGVLALMLAGQAEAVDATDTNSRAVAFARFGAWISGHDHVRVLQGSLFEPVAGERYDRILSNPPFVVSPESRFIYRDSGWGGDLVTQRIAQGAGDILQPGGFAVILANWATLAGEAIEERLLGWFQGQSVDVLILTMETRTPEVYANMWIHHTESPTPEVAVERFTEWMAFYEREKIAAISGGLIVIRKRASGPGWVRFDQTPDRKNAPGGWLIAQRFELMDFALGHPNGDDFVQQAFRVHPELELSQTIRPTESGGWALTRSELLLDGGFGSKGAAEPVVTEILGRCDGNRSLRSILDELAPTLGADGDRLAAAFSPVAYSLVEQGFLVPAALAQRWFA